MDIETDPPADEWLMTRLQGGNDAALAMLMLRWEIPVKRFIFRLVGSVAEAEDLAQEVFVRVFLKRQTYRVGSRFSSWVFAIAANQAKNRLRWWKRRPTVSLDAWGLTQVVTSRTKRPRPPAAAQASTRPTAGPRCGRR